MPASSYRPSRQTTDAPDTLSYDTGSGCVTLGRGEEASACHLPSLSEGNPLMLPGLTVPASLAALLQGFRSCFRLRPFEVFYLLTVGMVTQTGLCTVTGMLAGAGMQTVISHHRAHRFFSTHAWSADQLGLAMARLIVATLVPAGTDLHLAVDDSLFRRRGTNVHAAFWTHDASQPGRVTARGNRWVIVGIVVTLPFSCRPACRCCFGCGAARAPPPRSSWPAPWSGCWPARFPIGPSVSRPTRPTTATPCRTYRSGSPGPPASSATPCSTSPRRPPPASGDAPAPKATGSAPPPKPPPAPPGARPPWPATAVPTPCASPKSSASGTARSVNAPDGSSPRPRAPAAPAGSCCCSPPTAPPPPNRSSPATPPGGASRSPSKPRRAPWASARPATASQPPCNARSPSGCSP